jgi:hypothetical protein
MFKRLSASLLTLVASVAFAQSTVTVPISGNATITIPAPVPGAVGATGAQGPAGPQGAPGTSPTPAAVAAACVASPPCVAAIAAAVSGPVTTPPPVTPPPVTPPPVSGGALVLTTGWIPRPVASTPFSTQLTATGGTPPYKWSGTGIPSGVTLSTSGLLAGTVSAASTLVMPITVKDSASGSATTTFTVLVNATAGQVDPDFVILTGGVMKWSKNFNYSGMTETDGVTFQGQAASRFTATATPGGGGGWLPVEDAFFDTTGYNFLSITIAPTRAGQSWLVTPPEMPLNGVNDTPVPGAVGVNLEKFCPVALQINVFQVCKVPLHSGGLNMAVGQIMWKFGVQDQINAAGNNAALGNGNQWYIADARLTAN